jgi:hypothetical protein
VIRRIVNRKFGYLKLMGALLICLLLLGSMAESEFIDGDQKRFRFSGTEAPEILDLAHHTCYIYKNYIVHAIPSKSVGHDIKVFIRSDKSSGKSVCNKESEKENLFIKNTDAFWFAGISGDYLFIDNGTAPDGRDLIVYDIPKKKKIFRSRYLEAFSVEDKHTVSYYAGKRKIRSILECPESDRTDELKVWLTKGGSIALAEQMIVNLLSLKKRSTGKFRCVCLQ